MPAVPLAVALAVAGCSGTAVGPRGPAAASRPTAALVGPATGPIADALRHRFQVVPGRADLLVLDAAFHAPAALAANPALADVPVLLLHLSEEHKRALARAGHTLTVASGDSDALLLTRERGRRHLVHHPARSYRIRHRVERGTGEVLSDRTVVETPAPTPEGAARFVDAVADRLGAVSASVADGPVLMQYETYEDLEDGQYAAVDDALEALGLPGQAMPTQLESRFFVFLVDPTSDSSTWSQRLVVHMGGTVGNGTPSLADASNLGMFHVQALYQYAPMEDYVADLQPVDSAPPPLQAQDGSTSSHLSETFTAGGRLGTPTQVELFQYLPPVLASFPGWTGRTGPDGSAGWGLLLEQETPYEGAFSDFTAAWNPQTTVDPPSLKPFPTPSTQALEVYWQGLWSTPSLVRTPVGLQYGGNRTVDLLQLQGSGIPYSMVRQTFQITAQSKSTIAVPLESVIP